VISRLLSESVLELSLRSRWRQALFLLALALPALLFLYKTARIALAAQLGEFSNPAVLRRATTLDPANPKLHHRLGLIYAYSVEEINLAESLRHLRRATELQPHGARCWLDLAAVCESSGDAACAHAALAHALELRPRSPHFRWVAANVYLRLNRSEAAWPQFQRLLELSPGHAGTTFQLCLRASGDPQLVLEKVLPASPDPKLKLAYVNFLSTHGEVDFADRLWAETVTVGSSLRFPFSLAQPYLHRLLELGRIRQAVSVWRDLERLGVIQRPAAEDRANLVFNGDFEQPPLNAGFDWRFRELPYVSTDFSNPAAQRGANCLRVDFTVKRNDDYVPVYQLVPLSANQTYLLTAHVRSSEITSDSGPRLRVHDAACPMCLDVSSDVTVGTTPWHPVSLTFTTGPQTQLVQLSVWRPRSRSFPTEIAGSFWLDAVSLRPVVPPAEIAPANANP